MKIDSYKIWYALFFLIVNIVFLSMGSVYGAEQIARENGIIENLQAFLIFSAFATFAWIAYWQDGPPQTSAVLLASMCFVVFFREVDFHFMRAPLRISSLLSARDVSLLIILGLLSLFVARRRSDMPAMLKQLLQPSALLLIAVVALVATGELIEDWGSKQPLALLLEEMLELNAYALLLVTAVHFPDMTGAARPRKLQARRRVRPSARLRDPA
ncbi:MAG: hypothetical protein ACR2PO_04025 [Methyloligellaceae bacterium]